MWTAIISVIGTLLGVAVGGGISLLKDQAQFKREKDWEQKQLIREKLEEICITIEQIQNNYHERCIQAKVLIELGNYVDDDFSPPYDRLSISVDFYAPNLKQWLVLLLEYNALFVKVIFEAYSLVNSGEGSPQILIASLEKIYIAIIGVSGEMEKACADLARKCI